MASGQRIRDLMDQKKISARELATIVGVSRSTIHLDIKGDVGEIPAGRLSAIARALDTTISYLLNETAPPESGESGKVASSIIDSLPQEDQAEGIRYLEYLKSRAAAKET